MEGSEKQVAWAEKIREEKMEHHTYDALMQNKNARVNNAPVKWLENFLQIGDKKYLEFKENFIKNNPKPDSSDKSAMEKYKKAAEKSANDYKKWLWSQFQELLKNKKSAKWWIENRTRW